MIRIQKAKDSISNDDEFEGGEELVLESIDDKISIARALTENGDYVNSVKAWKRLLELNRDSPEIWNGMADSLSAAGSR